MAYGDFKDLFRRTTADKALRDKAFNIAKWSIDLVKWSINVLIKNFWWNS